LIELFRKNSLWIFCCHEIQFNQDGTFGSYVVTTPIAAVPVPSSVWLFGSVLAGFRLFGRRRTV
jgi:hypothetical protein